MQKGLSCVLMLSWSLWFGGMIALVIFIIRLFHADYDLGTHAGPVMFGTFAVYQIIVGLIACAAGTLLTVMTRRKLHAACSALLIAALALAVVIRMWTFEMNGLDRNINEQMIRFQRLHHSTTALYQTATVLLLISGIGWILTLVSSPARRRSDETAAATGFPPATAGRSTAA